MAVPMKNVDHFWLCMDDPTNLMVIAGFMEFEKPLDYERLCATLEHRLTRFDRFRQRVVKPATGVGIPQWETDPNFDIRSHLHRTALPEPADTSMLRETISDLMTIKLDNTKPLWQGHLIENVNGGCVLFFRIHHCIADGIALIHVLLSTTDVEDNAPWPDPYEHQGDRSPSYPFGKLINGIMANLGKTRSAGKQIRRQIEDAIANPFNLLELARTATGITADAAAVLARLALMPSHPSNCFKGELGVRKAVAWTKPMPFINIKNVGQAVEATINDVLIATVTGALRRYLEERNDRVNNLELRVAIPVNIRKPGKELNLGNYFSLVFLSLPVHLEDPVLRLREVKRRMDNLKSSPDAFIGFQVLNALGMSPASIARRAARFFGNKATAVLTNVPGPRQPLYFSGREIKNMMFWVPRTGDVGLGISIFSYNGYVTVGLASDMKLIPDPDRILDGFESDFEYQLDLVNTGRVFSEPLVINDRHTERRISEKAREDVLEKEKQASETTDADTQFCKAVTKTGLRCKRKPMPFSEFCATHKPSVDDDGQ